MFKLQCTSETLTTPPQTTIVDWIPKLNLRKKDRNDILNGEELNDLHVSTTMSLLQKDYPIVVQPPSLIYATGFDYCPLETIQIVHNGAHHWLLLSSMKGVVSIYDSLNMIPTDILIKQITQLFSPDQALPPFTQQKCHKQLGSTDCGVFTIAYAVDLLSGNDPKKISYDQNKMREHLVKCFEVGKLSPFPKYRINEDSTTSNLITNSEVSANSWKTPKRYHLWPRQKEDKNNITLLSNRFSPLMNESIAEKTKDDTK